MFEQSARWNEYYRELEPAKRRAMLDELCAYGLNQILQGSADEDADLGPLPGPSVALLAALAAAWALIGLYALALAARRKKAR